MSQEKPKPDPATIIADLLAKLKAANLSGPFAIEGNANCGGVLPDSLKLMERKRIG